MFCSTVAPCSAYGQPHFVPCRSFPFVLIPNVTTSASRFERLCPFLSRAFLAVDTKRVRASARLLSVRFSLRTEVRPPFLSFILRFPSNLCIRLLFVYLG